MAKLKTVIKEITKELKQYSDLQIEEAKSDATRNGNEVTYKLVIVATNKKEDTV